MRRSLHHDFEGLQQAGAMSLSSISPIDTDYGEHEAAMATYRSAGEARARALGNRGPIRFNADGSLSEDILEAYWRCGFYVFENVLRPEELRDLERDVDRILDRAPTKPDVRVDRQGRPALNAGREMFGFSLVKPLSDPVGGTQYNQGRHPVKMIEPTPPADAPDYVLQVVSRFPAVFRRLSSRIRTSRFAPRCGHAQRRGLHAFQRSDLHQATGTRWIRGVASGRHHALGYADLRQG